MLVNHQLCCFDGVLFLQVKVQYNLIDRFCKRKKRKTNGLMKI